MLPMFADIEVELSKLGRRPASWALRAIWVAMGVFFGYVLLHTQTAAHPNLRAAILLEDMPSNAVSGYPLFGGAIALALAVLATGSEYGWGTLRTLLLQGPSRPTLLGAKLVALATIALAYT